MDTSKNDEAVEQTSTPTKKKKREMTVENRETPARLQPKRIREAVLTAKRTAKEGETEVDEDECLPDNLTMTNVKSIIYNVIKDADVQKMLSNTLEEDISKHQEATYEPKMTRAKMKQVLAKEGNIPYPWPLSPVKSYPPKAKLNFTDLEFPDDDDDEDYNPEKDLAAERADLSGMYSDEDNDSIISSQMSDVGSPMCSTKSPQVSSHSQNLVLPNIAAAKHDNLPQTITCMGPPPPVQTSKETEKRFLDALDQLDLTDTIAGRTRSRQPLHHTTIDSIEAEFVPPDITTDMYGDPDLEEEDPEWKDFLSNLFRNDMPTDDEDDTEADPEYNVLAEPEPEGDDDHILPVRVTKNEINSLMEELYEAENQSQDDDSQDAPMRFNKPTPINKPTSVSELLVLMKTQDQNSSSAATEQPTVESSQVSKPELPYLTQYERGQLRRQMESYVQILAQHSVIGQSAAPELANQSHNFLKELETFSKRSQAGDQSSYLVCNLKPALELVGSYKPHPDTEESKQASADSKVTANTLSSHQQSVLADSPVFMYPGLLPTVQFLTDIKPGRLSFRPAEDRLICMGIDEFRKKKSVNEAIRDYLLPTYTTHNITMRIRNECKAKNRNKSVIGRFKMADIVPAEIFQLRRAESNTIMAPRYRPLGEFLAANFPDWLKKYSNIETVPVSIVAASELEKSTKLLPILPSPANSPSLTDANTPCKPNEVVNLLPLKSPATIKEAKNCESIEMMDNDNNPGLSSQSGPGILGILSDLSMAFSGGGDSKELDTEQESEVMLVTPTKKIIAVVKSPTKTHSPSKYLKLAATALKTPEKNPSSQPPGWKLRNNSPRRQELRSKAQAIIPKSFIPTVFVASPTKKAAKAISDKALNRASQKTKYKSPLKAKKSPPQVKRNTTPTTNIKPGSSTKRQRKSSKSKSPVAGDNADSDDDTFAALLEATSTSRAKHTKKHRYLACLATDIVENDPMRIEREDLFSRWYIHKVKEILGENSPSYTTFLEALISFGKQKRNPASFFEELRSGVLKHNEGLLDGFAAFLLPAQAVSCGERCYKACVQFNQARKFLRKMEVYFGANSKMFQRLVKLLTSCSPSKTTPSPTSIMRENITRLLKTHPLLLDEFNNFFPDAAPPKRHSDDYEELDLTEFDEETVMDGYEEMEIPEIEETNATPQCKCKCHEDDAKSTLYREKLTHCDNCKIAILHSRLFIHAGAKKGLRPAYIRYLNPLPPQPTNTHESDYEEEDSNNSGYESPFVDAVGSPDITVKVSSPSTSAAATESFSSSCRQTSESSTDTSSAKHDPEWTRNEDQFILEALQQSDSLSLSEESLQQLTMKLHHREPQSIKNRFNALVQLLTHELGEDSDSTR